MAVRSLIKRRKIKKRNERKTFQFVKQTAYANINEFFFPLIWAYDDGGDRVMS